MKISGSGKICSNICNEEIHISGSAVIEGDVRCTGMHISGSVKAKGKVESTGEIRVSGSGKIEGNAVCTELDVSGSVSAAEISAEKIMISGSCRSEKDINANEIKISGGINAQDSVKCISAEISGNICCSSLDAEIFKCSGSVEIKGLLNADKALIKLQRRSGKCAVGSIGGSEIRVERYDAGCISLLSAFRSGNYGKLYAAEYIEGDDIYLENTECPVVTGKNVVIGSGCRIGKVMYYDSCSIDEGSDVGEYRKI